MKKIALSLMMSAGLAQSPAFAESVATPKQVVQDYFSYLQTGKFAELMDLLDENVIWHQPGNSILSGTHVGKEAVGKLFGQFMAISGGTFKIDEIKTIMVNGDLVAASLHFSAHQCHYIDVLMSMDGVDLMKIVDGKIKEVSLFSADQDKEDAFWGLRQNRPH